MRFFQQFISKNTYLRAILCMAMCCIFAACSSDVTGSQATPGPSPAQTQAVPSPASTPTPPGLLRPELERGVVYPQYGPTAYGVANTAWQKGIKSIKSQTAATWLEMPILLEQSNNVSISVGQGATAPSLDAFVSGIHTAKELGFHLFVVPLLKVDTPGGWAGTIQISASYQQAWFDSYWNALKPYAQMAQENGVDQMAIGTEIVWLETNAPASLWNQLISRVRSVFKGDLTYDMNWYPSLTQDPTSWMKNSELKSIGLSEYVPLMDTPDAVSPDAMPALWKNKVGKLIDQFSEKVGKSIIISEIGYRSNSDALYSPFADHSSAPVDMQAQAAAYTAALTNVFADPHITGIFFWGWDNVGALGISGKQAVQVLYRWYSKAAS